MGQKNVIMGTIANYRWEDIKVFFKSLEGTGFSDEVVLFVCNIDEETQNRLRSLNYTVTLIPYQQVGLETIFITNDYRYYLYFNFLASNAWRYQNVFLTDVRDVYFQKDPFKAGFKENVITVAKESKKISEEIYNTRWVLQKYGSRVYWELHDKTILCSGTTFGPANLMKDYVYQMMAAIFYEGYVAFTDQAIHNYLIHSGKIQPITFADNYDGPIMTIGIEFDWNITVTSDKLILLQNGQPAPIVHQYDRKPSIVNMLNDMIDG